MPDFMTKPPMPIRFNPALYPGVEQAYCGPAALAAITGMSREAMAAWINRVRGHRLDRKVRKTYTVEMCEALDRLGYQAARDYWRPGLGQRRYLTLDYYCRKRPRYLRERLLLVLITNHWVVIHRGRLYDSRYPDGIRLTELREYKRRKVRVVYHITDLAGRRRTRRDILPNHL